MKSAKALMLELCPNGFWFLDDPDDFREIGGDIAVGHGTPTVCS